MNINLIGMILNNCGRSAFDGVILDDNGNPMAAADSLHYMIMEYAKVFNGGTSDVVTLSREVLTARPETKILRDMTEAELKRDMAYSERDDVKRAAARLAGEGRA